MFTLKNVNLCFDVQAKRGRFVLALFVSFYIYSFYQSLVSNKDLELPVINYRFEKIQALFRLNCLLIISLVSTLWCYFKERKCHGERIE